MTAPAPVALVESLRKWAELLDAQGKASNLPIEAADLIQSQAVRIAELEGAFRGAMTAVDKKIAHYSARYDRYSGTDMPDEAICADYAMTAMQYLRHDLDRQALLLGEGALRETTALRASVPTETEQQPVTPGEGEP